MSEKRELPPEERRRWRLITGPGEEERSGRAGGAGGGGGAGEKPEGRTGNSLSPEDRKRDRCLEMIYGRPDGFGYDSGPPTPGRGSGGGTGDPTPYLPQWLEDLRSGFPRSVITQVQHEALERGGWERLILEPENLEAMKHDVHLVSALLALKDMVPEATKAVARRVVTEIVRRIEAELKLKIVRALSGRPSHVRLCRSGPSARIDWKRTIQRSLRHYQPELETLVPDPVLFRDADRKQFDDRHVILVVDQSGSMAASLIYASVMAAVLASLKNLSTKLLLFDTAVVDVSDHLSDPVDILFGAQLGGGTSIQRALAAAEARIVDPRRTLLVLISDLEEGDPPELMFRRFQNMKSAGVTAMCLLGLTNEGSVHFNRAHARKIASMGIPAFAATPDRFVDVLRCALDGRSLATLGIPMTPAEEP